MRLIAYTQVLENHTSYDENYSDAQLKTKGRTEYLLANLTPQEVCDLGQSGLEDIVCRKKQHIERDNQSLKEWIIDWDILDHNELTQSEKDQQEFDGKIDFHPIDVTDEKIMDDRDIEDMAREAYYDSLEYQSCFECGAHPEECHCAPLGYE